MVTPEELEALDLMCWLRNGDAAARLAFCNQSTISRRSQQALQLLIHFLAMAQGPIHWLGLAPCFRWNGSCTSSIASPAGAG